jgi:hypothetical protein
MVANLSLSRVDSLVGAFVSLKTRMARLLHCINPDLESSIEISI